MKTVNEHEIIDILQLESHVEGGYFRRTYCAEKNIETDREDHSRPITTCIYYMLTRERPISFFAINQSDLILFYQSGSPITIHLIDAEGNWSSSILGPDISKGQRPQLISPGGCWKAYELTEGDYCLMSEVVSPGFDYRDMTMPTLQDLRETYPHLVESVGKYVK